MIDDLIDRQDFQLPEGLLETRVNDELILLHPEKGEYFGLNSTGVDVLLAARAKKNLRELAERISRESLVSIEEVEEDVRKLLQDLLKHDIIRVP